MMDRQPEDFRKRLQGMAKHDCIPTISRNYLSDRFAKELRRARESNNTTPCSTTLRPPSAAKRFSGCSPSLPGVQVLKTNLARESPCNPREEFQLLRDRDDTVRPSSPLRNLSRFERREDTTGCRRTPSPDRTFRNMPDRSKYSEHGVQSDLMGTSRLRGLTDLEEKVEFLNNQAQQLKKEQGDRERMTTMYDEALEEVRRLRERDTMSGGQSVSELEAKIRRLECERDDALVKVRTAQVDNEELRLKLERSGEEGNRERQRIMEKLNSLESRLHATETDRDELARRHTRNLETMAKLETQLEEHKSRVASLEDQKQDHLKQIDNLGLFIKDLEQSSKQMHDRLDEKRYELHQYRDRVHEMEDLVSKIEQHLQYEKDRFIQMQNDAYQAQIRSQELRNDIRNALKKKSKNFD